MSSIVIRNIPEEVHDALRKVAADRKTPVETLAREVLAEFAARTERRGIDFERLARKRAALGIEEWPSWTPDLDDPALSRRVLGLEDEDDA